MHVPSLDPCLYHMLRYLPVALLSLVNNDFNGLMKYTMSCDRYDNLFFLQIAVFTLATSIALLTSSSLLVSEAAKLGDSYHHVPYRDKCGKCSKINIATVR